MLDQQIVKASQGMPYGQTDLWIDGLMAGLMDRWTVSMPKHSQANRIILVMYKKILNPMPFLFLKSVHRKITTMVSNFLVIMEFVHDAEFSFFFMNKLHSD